MIEPDENDIFPTEKPSWEEIGSMNGRIRELEDQLAKARNYWVYWMDSYDDLWDEKARVDGIVSNLKKQLTTERELREMLQRALYEFRETLLGPKPH